MEKTAGRVLKANDINIQGSVCLGLGQSPKKQVPAGSVAACTPNAGIVEKTADFAVIEITCSCGTKTRIRCDYADTHTG